MSQITLEPTEGYRSGSLLEGRSQLTDAQLLHIAGSEIRICKGELATYKLRELNRKGLAKFLYSIVLWLEADKNDRATRRAVKKGAL